MCELTEKKAPREQVKALVRDPKYICGNCNRAAAEEANLCKPEAL
jgi:hypothetical protein